MNISPIVKSDLVFSGRGRMRRDVDSVFGIVCHTNVDSHVTHTIRGFCKLSEHTQKASRRVDLATTTSNDDAVNQQTWQRNPIPRKVGDNSPLN